MFICPACYHEFDGVIYHDELGAHTVCPECDSSFNVAYPDVPSKRTNAGYKIISSILINAYEEIVLGSMDTQFGTKYATWLCAHHSNYCYGHYFMFFDEARDDLIQRAAEASNIRIIDKKYNIPNSIKTQLVEDCEIPEEVAAQYGKAAAFNEILSYEGIIGYDLWIIELINKIYGIDLTEIT